MLIDRDRNESKRMDHVVYRTKIGKDFNPD
jgi:hypothetical protein